MSAESVELRERMRARGAIEGVLYVLPEEVDHLLELAAFMPVAWRDGSRKPGETLLGCIGSTQVHRWHE